MPHLETARLTIVPSTLDLLHAACRNPALLGHHLHLRVPADWPGPDIAAALPSFIRQLETDPAQGDWGVHLVGHTATRTLIGFAGCNNGSPDATGMVEIGYDVLPAYQRHGYATEATGQSWPGSSRSRRCDVSSPIVTWTIAHHAVYWSASGCGSKLRQMIA